MKDISTEAFISWCDEMYIAEEALSTKAKLALGIGGWISAMVIPIIIGIRTDQKDVKKYLNKSYKGEKTPKIKISYKKPTENPRNREGYWENDYAKEDLDLWDDVGDLPEANGSIPKPTSSQLKQAGPMLEALSKFEKEMISACKVANKACEFPNEFEYIDPGKYAICGDNKRIHIWKYFAGYECYSFARTYPTDNGKNEEAEEAWKKLNKAFDEFENTMYSLERAINQSNNNFKVSIWGGKYNVETPPATKGRYRLYWCIDFGMDIS